jgi:hypothetical protein
MFVSGRARFQGELVKVLGLVLVTKLKRHECRAPGVGGALSVCLKPGGYRHEAGKPREPAPPNTKSGRAWKVCATGSGQWPDATGGSPVPPGRVGG